MEALHGPHDGCMFWWKHENIIFSQVTYHTVKCQINTPSALTSTLVDWKGPKDHFGGFPANFDQFWPNFSETFHHKVLGAHLFKQVRLFGTLRYLEIATILLITTWFYDYLISYSIHTDPHTVPETKIHPEKIWYRTTNTEMIYI